MPKMLTFRRLWQWDPDLEVNLGYLANLVLKDNKSKIKLWSSVSLPCMRRALELCSQHPFWVWKLLGLRSFILYLPDFKGILRSYQS